LGKTRELLIANASKIGCALTAYKCFAVSRRSSESQNVFFLIACSNSLELLICSEFVAEISMLQAWN
jgi:hypothetical protein